MRVYLEQVFICYLVLERLFLFHFLFGFNAQYGFYRLEILVGVEFLASIVLLRIKSEQKVILCTNNL